MDPTDQLLRLEDFSESIPVSGRKEINGKTTKDYQICLFLLFFLFFGPKVLSNLGRSKHS